ncbi:hypothetical protein PAPYR_12151 [Paratrimastix pyriformis]|uniref:Uncharacterized protein n=1 Tax=Paratrimastix pyriformis TaxID=342808 RepID=A0ABQ8U712_9EUKA|nr:hypothetical protein PAPYR_12151 [Paratrimastix pyriformis]
MRYLGGYRSAGESERESPDTCQDELENLRRPSLRWFRAKQVVLRECINTIVAEPVPHFRKVGLGLNMKFRWSHHHLRHRTAHCTAKFILSCISSFLRHPSVRLFSSAVALSRCSSSGSNWHAGSVPTDGVPAALLPPPPPQASPAPIVVIPPAGNDIKITMPQTPRPPSTCEDPPQVDRLRGASPGAACPVGPPVRETSTVRHPRPDLPLGRPASCPSVRPASPVPPTARSAVRASQPPW